MRKAGIPVTREHYLAIVSDGKAWGAENEDALPTDLQDWTAIGRRGK
jgi:hypothetical protein